MRVGESYFSGNTSGASMRPGQAAPDEGPSWSVQECPGSVASMRPGQAAPDEGYTLQHGMGGMSSFNEAGASSPG